MRGVDTDFKVVGLSHRKCGHHLLMRHTVGGEVWGGDEKFIYSHVKLKMLDRRPTGDVRYAAECMNLESRRLPASEGAD